MLRVVLVIAFVALAGVLVAHRRVQTSAPAVIASALPGRPAAFRRPAPPRVVVYVAGRVRRPGVYRLPGGSRVDDALRAAGGPAAQADLVATNLAQALTDGEEVVVPALGADPGLPRASSTRSSGRGRRAARSRAGGAGGRRSRKSPPAAPVDINAAGVAGLETLPGIGPALAARIVAFRAANGPFTSRDDLLDVAGLTPAKVDALAPYVVVR